MNDAFPLIELEGDAEMRGLAYGRAAGDRIERGLQIYRHDFSRQNSPWKAVLATARQYLPVLERFDVDLYQEIVAIAQGAEQPIEAIALLNARTELGIGTHVSEECTAALALPAATADGHVLHGQNWDWRPGCVSTGVVLRIDCGDGHQVLTFCEAGQLARHGLNSAGIALTANGLQTPDDPRHDGIPTPMLRRRLLLQRSLAEAATEVFAAQHSCSHALTISHSDGEAYCLETTPRKMYWLLAEDALLTHANHFKTFDARLMEVDLSLARHPESLYRDSRTLATLRRNHGAITVETFKEAFADRYGWPNSVCRPPTERADDAESATVASLIMDTTDRKLWIAPAPYVEANYTEYGLA